MATTTYKVLGQVNPAANTVSTLYKAPAYVSTVISSVTVCNQSNTATTFSIAVRPADSSLSTKHYLNYNTALQPYDTVPITIGITLATTDVIDVSSTSSSVSFTAFGSEIGSFPSNNIPTINSVVITDSGYNTTSTTAVSTSSGGYIKLLGSGFDYNPIVYVGTTSTSAVYVSAVEVRARVPNNPVGTYNVMLFNGTGVGTVYQSGLLYSPEPTLTTGIYAGTYFLNVQLSGSGDAPLTYSLISGSLPSGASLSSSGLITGTAISYGTYTFTVKITDAQGQYITPTVQLSIATMPSNIELLLVGGGGAGGGAQSTNARGGGGGAGGLVYFSSQTVSIGVLYAITVGAGGTGASALPGVTGTNSTFIGGTSTIVAIAGGGGGSWIPNINGIAGGSGGGGAGVNTGIGGTSTQFATYGYGVGYPGGTGTAYVNNTGSSGAGGGGAGSKGSDAAAGAAGTGGTGTFTTIISTSLALTLGIGQYITATNSVYFAGGGGGGGGTASGIGGYGGGGSGALTTDLGNAGTPYTGGGGGGAGGSGGGTAAGANGGSGVAILRYPSTYKVFPSISGSYTLTTASGYNTYLFTGSSYIYLTEDRILLPTVEYVMVGGGGGGGFYNGGGGGGAGGLLTGTIGSIQTNTTYTVTVGTGGPGSTSVNSYGSNGTPSVFGGISTVGGGGAGSGDGTAYNGQLGGSGGGGATTGGTNGTGGAGTAGQGNNGGVGNTDGASYRVGGGGGGAGFAGIDGSSAGGGGAGGTGTITTLISTTTAISLSIGQYVTATNAVYFAGGGGGAGYSSPRFGGPGGLGGGGAGVITGPAGNGSPNSGGGGGGIINAGGATAGGSGGSGVVILRYPIVYGAATSTSGTGTNVFIENGYRYYVFKSSGSITF